MNKSKFITYFYNLFKYSLIHSFFLKELSKLLLASGEKGWNEKESVFSQVIENVSRWLGKEKSVPTKSIFEEPDIDEGPPMKRTRFDPNRFSAVDSTSEPQLDMVTTMLTIQDNKKK